MIHFDTHADTGLELEESPHGVPFSSAVIDGHLDGHNIVQIGLRGAWPFPEEFDWMREQGFRWHTIGEIIERGIGPVVRDAIEYAQSRAPRTYLTVDIDVLDPAFAPGTGTAEPGGLMTRELLWAVRTIASRSTSARWTSSRSRRRSTRPASPPWPGTASSSRRWAASRCARPAVRRGRSARNRSQLGRWRTAVATRIPI